MSPAAPALAESPALLRAGPALAGLVRVDPASDRSRRDAAAAALLRRLAGRDDIEVERRSSGRPRLRPPHGELGVSMACRGGLLLAGFSAAGRVGVDIELDDAGDGLDALRLAADHYAGGEARLLASLPPPERRDVFLRLWVAKEAALKLTGRGVFDGLRAPDLSALAGGLRADGAVVEAALGEPWPVRLAVRRLPAPPARGVYCALACAAA